MPKDRGWRLQGYGARARFNEIISGVPMLAEWELTNTFRDSPVPQSIERGRVTNVLWLPSPTAGRDTVRRPPH